MKLPSNVKKKSWLWNLTPVRNFAGHAIYPNIYLSKKVYKNLTSTKPKHEYVGVLIHEQTHIKREKEQGWLIFGIKYIFLQNFRFNEEFVAIKEQMKYLKKHKAKFDTDKTAHYLSSYFYLWCCQYETAKKQLDEAWKKS